MDEKDRLLLTYLQNGLSLTLRPFDVLSAKIDADSAELLVRIQRLKQEGIFAGIKAILNPRAFHYQSAWIAVRAGPERQASGEAVPKNGSSAQFSSEALRSCAEVFGRHPGVVYGCEREHEFNLWFFIATPAGHDLELHIRCLERLAGIQRALFLPVRKVFKGSDLLSSLDARTFPAIDEPFERRRASRSPHLTVRIGQEHQAPAGVALKDGPSAEEIETIRQLQEPFPLTDTPYRRIAVDLRISEDQALERVKTLAKKGYLKRIGSFLKPEVFLSGARTLVVWQIPEEKLERIGSEIAGFSEVLYADQRPVFTDFPYSLYTMVQANTSTELEVLARRVQDRIGKWPYRALMTTRELKKNPMKYFPKELDGWWCESRHVAETAFH
jgi:DNA-binding Lrp family transcriptional regulator